MLKISMESSPPPITKEYTKAELLNGEGEPGHYVCNAGSNKGAVLLVLGSQFRRTVLWMNDLHTPTGVLANRESGMNSTYVSDPSMRTVFEG